MSDLALSVPRRAAARLPRRAAPALLLYAAVRLLGIATLALWSDRPAKDVRTLLSERWDSLWYVRVVEHGYDFTLTAPDGRVLSDMAFFPLLPWLESALSAVTPLSPADAGLVVSAAASLLAAAGLYAIGERLYGARAGIALAVLWAALPVGIVQSMAYSESLFTALAAWSLYAVLSGRWVWAGTLSALAGLTRPVGAAVVAAIWLTGLAVLWAADERRRGVPVVRRLLAGVAPPPGRGRMLAGMALAPLGWLGFLLWVGAETGDPLGYFEIQAEWGNGFDGGLAFARFVGARLTDPGPAVLAGLALGAGVALLVWVFVLCVRRGQPLPLLTYAAAVVVLALGASGFIGSKPRLLLPAFPLLLPAAQAMARARPRTAWCVAGALTVVSAVYGAFWLNGTGPP
ncbi:hypothetical protein AB0M28_23410 [Streptomyces sp. NPDC051940]|uniref:glycosyltransferase family 39 protein n=1 Tax=Streptomyces sp. NPDC051940 TaxID=3155675 RepID=UPI0034376B1A